MKTEQSELAALHTMQPLTDRHFERSGAWQ